MFSDNAGGIVFDDDYLVCDKVETHNSPSALDPYGGAMTGIVGVNRDCLGFGQGAQPILNRYGFCLPHYDDASMIYRDQAGDSPLPSARRLIDGVIKGIEDGGNQSGIPTPQGFLMFDEPLSRQTTGVRRHCRPDAPAPARWSRCDHQGHPAG